MKKTSILLLALLSFTTPCAYAGPDKTLLFAREAIASPSVSPQDVLLKYSEALKKTHAASVAAEYAYAQAYAGVPEAALYNIDRALISEPLNPEARFYLSEILNAFGLADASAEFSVPVPAWLKTPLKLPALDIAAPSGDFEQVVLDIEQLMSQGRYAQSAVLLDRLCGQQPDNARCYAGYALALEKLGAYKSAAAQARKNLELSKTPERKSAAEAYAANLEKRQPLKFSAVAGHPLKGRYLAFFGGGLNRTNGEITYSFSSRAGKFVSDRLDISANAAISGGNPVDDYNGLTLGVGGRYNEPLGFAPVNGTLAAKLERVPAPDKNLTFLISPGLSYFLRDSSVDLFWDLALSGPYSGSVTMSLGYTVYFGGAR
ncbi:MAG: hypothetical protein AUJ51_05245 [Elusimicrobia bacterium CG1_02_56_21]|nr:MAG: hypothetical protein AUJ51_05245 [Elusimicrobia bacterium CG1_02_56_21]